MSDLALTFPGDFADGVNNTMDPEHFTVPMGEVEDWINGKVGYDGVGDNNWDGNESLRGVNFRSNAVRQVWRVSNDADFWTVVQDVSLSGGPPDGLNTSELPGSSMRFYLRHDAEWVATFYTARVIRHGVLSSFTADPKLDGTTLATFALDTGGSAAPAHSSQRGISFGVVATSGVGSGWHDIKWTTATSGGKCLVMYETELVVVAAYR